MKPANENEPEESRLRREAEQRLAEAPSTNPAGQSAEALLHELQVHQIELEMQSNELRAALLAAEESRDRYFDLYELAPVGYLTLTRTGRIAEGNLVAAALLGVAREKLIGSPFGHYVIAEDGDRWHVHFIRVLADATRKTIELGLTRLDGSCFCAQVDALPIAVDGKASTVRIALSDISTRKQAEEKLADQSRRLEERALELEEARTAAEAANIAKSTFLATMSHEIRTPMNGIVGMVSILRREGVTPAQAERLDTIDASAQHLLYVINNILDISKIEAGKFALESLPVSFAGLLKNIDSIASGLARARKIEMRHELSALPEGLHGDPTRLQQALLNYVTNAIKFTEAGSITLRIGLQEEAPDSAFLRFEVRDTGIGVPPDAIPRLFSAFEQADNSITRRYGGTGLGLAITRHLAEMMGGEAGGDSTPGLGSTFWFTARLTKGGSMACAAPTSDLDAEALVRHRYSGRRVLVVDDEPINREVAQFHLEVAGLIVDGADDGEAAVAAARQWDYAFVLMDMRMPRLDGLDATRQMRELPGYRQTPIIAMTANAFAEDRALCIEAGMSDFLSKPFNPDELFACLLRAMSGPQA